MPGPAGRLQQHRDEVAAFGRGEGARCDDEEVDIAAGAQPGAGRRTVQVHAEHPTGIGGIEVVERSSGHTVHAPTVVASGSR